MLKLFFHKKKKKKSKLKAPGWFYFELSQQAETWIIAMNRDSLIPLTKTSEVTTPLFQL